MSKIIFKNVSKKYKDNSGIKNLNLTIEKGSIMGLIGPNGAGKSTTIRTLLNLIKLTNGEIKVFGLDNQDDNLEMLKKIGYLPGELNYYDNSKGIDILKYSESFYKKDCSLRREELCKLLNFDPNLKIDSLSLGNKKKLGIIDALQHEPEFLIFDEPTSGLDPLIQQKFFEILREEKAKGVTILFSSHVISEVQKVCDEVAIIKNNELLMVQSVNEIRENLVKNIELYTKAPITTKINGMEDIKIDGTKATFIYKGDLNNLILFLAKYEIVNLEITEPTLEQVFIHYYE